MRQIKQPYNLFVLASIIILVISLIFWGESLVINIFGFTIFIDGQTTIYSLILLMIVYWTVYKVLFRYLKNDLLTWAHIVITLSVVGYFLLTGTWYSKSNAVNDFEADLFRQLMINRERTIRVLSATGIIFIVGQVTFVYNLATGRKGRLV